MLRSKASWHRQAKENVKLSRFAVIGGKKTRFVVAARHFKMQRERWVLMMNKGESKKKPACLHFETEWSLGAVKVTTNAQLAWRILFEIHESNGILRLFARIRKKTSKIKYMSARFVVSEKSKKLPKTAYRDHHHKFMDFSWTCAQTFALSLIDDSHFWHAPSKKKSLLVAGRRLEMINWKRKLIVCNFRWNGKRGARGSNFDEWAPLEDLKLCKFDQFGKTNQRSFWWMRSWFI